MSQNDSDGSDWFDKDEDEIVNSLKAKSKSVTQDENCEYIAAKPKTNVNNDLSKLTISTSTQSIKTLTTPKLREITQMDPIDAFLFISTLDFNFYKEQINANDSMDKIILYIRILVVIAKLELPGYYLPFVEGIVENECLLNHFLKISTKLAMKTYKTLWNDLDKVDEILCDMEDLLWRACQSNLLSKKCRSIIEDISAIMKKADSSLIAERETYKSFTSCLECILTSVDKKGNSFKSVEIYPTWEELFSTDSTNENEEQDVNPTEEACEVEANKSLLLNKNYKNSAEYIAVQKHLLREDFMISLKNCIKSLKETKECNPPTTLLLQGVTIILNEEFSEANISQLLFVDILGNQRADKKKKMDKDVRLWLQNLKSGSLLCLSTSLEFDNLILAVVTFNETKKKGSGNVSIEIVRQYNIGCIYEKTFLMFECPAFFEPYRNVFGALKSYEASTMPMEKYIVFDEKKICAPSYLQENTTYTYNNVPFAPLSKVPKTLPLNESQIAAYKNALTQEFCIIQGPPGTGKTHLSVEIVKTLITGAKTPIILITYTNESLDKFLLQISKHTDSIIRFGSQSKNKDLEKYNISNFNEVEELNPLVKRLYYMEKMTVKNKFEALQKIYHDFDGTEESYQSIIAAQMELREYLTKRSTVNNLFQYYFVKNKQIIAMTTTVAAKINFLFKLLKSSDVIFEEAAEILESHIVACLTPYTKHVIMIGDHMQLQPYTSNFQHSRIYELNVSLFERLINRNIEYTKLNKQYRMRPEIAELICPIIYENLENAEGVTTYPHVNGMKMNLYFVNHNEREGEDKISKFNLPECKQLVNLAKHLISNKANSLHRIVILSPYAKQVELISEMLQKDRKLSAIKVATVDSFQGLEADIVLLSLVRSNNKFDIGFLNEKTRICVALSRAKFGLYIIGNMSLLASRSKIWRQIESKLLQLNALGNKFPKIS